MDVHEITAPAKINLILKILGRRQDGYHDICSLMQKVELADRITIRRQSAGITLTCPDSGLPEDSANLVYRAADIFLSAVAVGYGVAITLEKNIPVAAGLGGGSSDAAAVLLGLDRIFETGCSQRQLNELALQLGADVPFFVNPWPAAWATGIGEQLTPAPGLADCWILLVNPAIEVSTKWVYENFALTSGHNQYILADKFEQSGKGVLSPLELHGKLVNDLESVTSAHFSKVRDIKETLLGQGADGVLMSGSGPTVFGLFIDHMKACEGENFFKQTGNQVFLTRPLV